jgi:hypothetical protein
MSYRSNVVYTLTTHQVDECKLLDYLRAARAYGRFLLGADPFEGAIISRTEFSNNRSNVVGLHFRLDDVEQYEDYAKVMVLSHILMAEHINDTSQLTGAYIGDFLAQGLKRLKFDLAMHCLEVGEDAAIKERRTCSAELLQYPGSTKWKDLHHFVEPTPVVEITFGGYSQPFDITKGVNDEPSS